VILGSSAALCAIFIGTQAYNLRKFPPRRWQSHKLGALTQKRGFWSRYLLFYKYFDKIVAE
jgi:hypothetical protein